MPLCSSQEIGITTRSTRYPQKMTPEYALKCRLCLKMHGASHSSMFANLQKNKTKEKPTPKRSINHQVHLLFHPNREDLFPCSGWCRRVSVRNGLNTRTHKALGNQNVLVICYSDWPRRPYSICVGDWEAQCQQCSTVFDPPLPPFRPVFPHLRVQRTEESAARRSLPATAMVTSNARCT
jgi:hypothetical protein